MHALFCKSEGIKVTDIIKPRKLKTGDCVALIAPSGPILQERLDATIAAVKSYGLEPVVYESVKSRHGYLAGSDALRAADLTHAFADDSIAGVICARGGYGAQKLHRLIDWETVKRNPKVFCGYSDVTYLHIMMNQYCGFETYHTPMPSTEWYKGLDAYTDKWLKKALFGGDWGELTNCDKEKRFTVTGGKGKGTLVGGNLSLVASAIGTPYALKGEGSIIFLEDVEEAPYSVDRMLTHMVASGTFDGCKGVVLGYYTDCTADDPAKSLTLMQIFNEILAPLGIPVMGGVTCGHDLPTLSLPMGARAELDADAQTLRITEV